MKTAYLKYNSAQVLSHIHPEIYGHFTEHLGRCIYHGIYTGKDSTIPNTDGIRNDIVSALREIAVPVLRWPGGCFADEYHWKDGVGAQRSPILNTHWGGVVEDNSFGTHEFFELCGLLGCKAYLAGNTGSGTVQELAEWVQYITGNSEMPMGKLRSENGREEPWDLAYLGIGNENWGCGGNMTASAYADLYRRYQTFAKNHRNQDMMKVACGPNADDYNWTKTIMEQLKTWHTGAISLHYYTIPSGSWEHKGDAVTFTDEEYYSTISKTLYMDELIRKHGLIMDHYDPEGNIKLIIDEWGCWYDVEPGTNPGFLFQQNTMRDAIVAAINLNLFNQHSDRVMMANLAQAVNVLQAVLLTDGERLVKTPTWYVFKMFVPHHDADLIRTSCACSGLHPMEQEIPHISYSMSKKDGKLFLTVSNLSLDEECKLHLDSECRKPASAEGTIICSDVRAYNDFDGVQNVKIQPYQSFCIENGMITMSLPPCSVVSLTIHEEG